ncbi:MAG: hypothetical protein ACRDLF_00500 [Solirubrobacteraceae bacterium]
MGASMGLFGEKKKQQVTAATIAEITPNPSLGHFGAYSSKTQFMIDWAADIFRQAGQNPSDQSAGVQEMAKIAAFTQIWFRLRAVAVDKEDKKSIKYLDTFDRSNLLPALDTMYPTVMRYIAKAAGCWPGLVTDNYISNFDNIFDEVFTDCRAEFVEGVLKGDF